MPFFINKETKAEGGKPFTQCHPACKWQNQGSNTGLTQEPYIPNSLNLKTVTPPGSSLCPVMILLILHSLGEPSGPALVLMQGRPA